MSSPSAENSRRRIEGNSSAMRFGVVHLGSRNMEFEGCPAARCASSLANAETISLAVAAASAGHRKGVKGTKSAPSVQSPSSNGRTARANCQRGRSIAVTHEGRLRQKTGGICRFRKLKGAAAALPSSVMNSRRLICPLTRSPRWDRVVCDGPNKHHPTKGTGAGNPAARLPLT